MSLKVLMRKLGLSNVIHPPARLIRSINTKDIDQFRKTLGKIFIFSLKLSQMATTIKEMITCL